jgi:hypothetical protein
MAQLPNLSKFYDYLFKTLCSFPLLLGRAIRSPSEPNHLRTRYAHGISMVGLDVDIERHWCSRRDLALAIWTVRSFLFACPMLTASSSFF